MSTVEALQLKSYSDNNYQYIELQFRPSRSNEWNVELNLAFHHHRKHSHVLCTFCCGNNEANSAMSSV